MRQALLVAVLLALTSSSYAFDLQGIKAADLKTPGNNVPAVSPAVSADKNFQSLWMNVYLRESFMESEASDFSQEGIDVRVHKVLDTTFQLSIRVGNSLEWLSFNGGGSSFSLSGSDANLSMSDWGSSYNISGSVRGDNGRTTFVNLTLYRDFASYSFHVSGMGLNMNVSRNNISGNYDDREYSKKGVAAIVALVLAAQVDSMPS